MRCMRRLTRLLVVLIVLGAIYVAADFGAARIFERRAAAVFAQRYDLSTRPVVRVRDFPFLPHLALGRFSAIDLAAADVQSQGVTADRVEVHLHGVTVDRAIYTGAPGTVRVQRADGEVRITQDEVGRLLASRLRGGSVQLTAQDVRVVLDTDVAGVPVHAAVTGRLGVAGGRLTFVPTGIDTGSSLDELLRGQLTTLFTVSVPLPRLPAGVQVEHVVTEPGAIVISGRAEAVRVAT